MVCQLLATNVTGNRLSDINRVGQQTLFIDHVTILSCWKGIYTQYTHQSSKEGIKRRVACYGLNRSECYNIKTNMSPNLDIDMFPARN